MSNIRAFRNIVAARTPSEILAGLFFLLSLGFYLYLASILMHGPDFNDETEKLVGGMMIHDGMRLYKDMFDHHGPFSYILAQLFYALTGSRNIAHYRALPLLFSLFSMISIMVTPVIRDLRFRLFAASLMALGLAALQANYGLMLGMYQIYAGHLVVCVLALLVLPAIVNRDIPRSFAFVGGLSLGFIFFCGYSFVVSCTMLGTICIYQAWFGGETGARWTTIRFAALGLLSSLLVVAIWLACYGDILGYFVYHFYFNQIVYAKFSAYHPLEVLHFVLPLAGYWTHFHGAPPWFNSAPSFLLSYIVSAAASIFAALFVASRWGASRSLNFKIVPILVLLVFGIIFTDPRAADDFQEDTLVIVVIGLVSIVSASIFERSGSRINRLSVVTLCALCLFALSLVGAQFLTITQLYGVSPYKYYHMKGALTVAHSEGMDFLRTIVAPDEFVQQFPYQLMFYIAVDRMPASGNYYYLPWQNAYFQHPILGYKIDVCKDMETKLPKVIYYDKSVVWVYPTSDYIACVEKLLNAKYFRTTKAENVWIRADIAVARDDVLNSSIVPEDFDAHALLPDDQIRVERAKIKFQKLKSESGDACIKTPSNLHDPLQIGNCSDGNALALGVHKSSQTTELVTSPQFNCLEVIDASVDDGAGFRLWPCQGVANQKFVSLPANGAFWLKVGHSNKCMSVANGSLVQAECDQASQWSWE